MRCTSAATSATGSARDVLAALGAQRARARAGSRRCSPARRRPGPSARRPSRAPGARPAADSAPRRRARPWSRTRRRTARSAPRRSPGARPRCPRPSRGSCRRRASGPSACAQAAARSACPTGVRVTGTASCGQRSAPEQPRAALVEHDQVTVAPGREERARPVDQERAWRPGPGRRRARSAPPGALRGPSGARRGGSAMPGTAPARSSGTGSCAHSISRAAHARLERGARGRCGRERGQRDRDENPCQAPHAADSTACLPAPRPCQSARNRTATRTTTNTICPMPDAVPHPAPKALAIRVASAKAPTRTPSWRRRV